MNKRRRQAKLPEPISTEVTQLSHEGRGIAKINGKTTFIFNALPTESVFFRYTKTHGQWDEGETVTINQEAKERVAPICQHFGVCGGCSLQHMHHDFQVDHKQSAVLSLLHQAGIQTPPSLLPPLLGKTKGYRRKARLGVRYVPKKGAVLIGFRERKTHYITQTELCHALDPRVGMALPSLSHLISSLTIKEKIPQLEVAIGDQDVAIIIRHLASLTAEDEQKLIHFFRLHQWQLYLQPHGIESIYRLSPEAHSSLPYYQLPRYNLTFHFHPSHFTQINSEINVKMIDSALHLLDLSPTDQVLDLFCGIGNFSLPIAQKCQQVTGVEGSKSAIEQAEKNAAYNNHLTNCSFYTADLFADWERETWAQQQYHKLLLDPPRSGAKKIVENIKLWLPQRIVYISCNPATFARDAHVLVQQGYELTQLGILNMFPHTQHTEIISLFQPKKTN